MSECSMNEEQVLRIPAELERMDEVLDFASGLIDAHGSTPLVRTQLRMAMEELYVNIAHYAYPEGGGWAEIRGSVKDGCALGFIHDRDSRPIYQASLYAKVIEVKDPP